MKLMSKTGRHDDVQLPAAKKKRSKKWIAVLVVLLLAGGGLYYFFEVRQPADNGAADVYTYVNPEKRDITESITGSGTLEPADSYTVTTLVSGDILSAGFEEGDVVSKGDVLYEIDSSDASVSIQRAELSLNQSQRSYDSKVSSASDLTITAPISGTISELTLQTGDTVNTQTAVAKIEDTRTLTLTEYYSDEYAGQIYVGMQATVSIPGLGTNLGGSVEEISALKRTSETGISCFGVTVEVANTGNVSAGQSASCKLLASDGTALYPSILDDDGFDSAGSTTVYAEISGTVSDVKVRNGETVSAGQVVALLSSDTLSDDILNAADSLKDAELSLQNQYESLDDYTVTAPIDGTIVDKYYKQGETSESGKTLCIIYDLSSLTLTLNVDELDIGQVAVGQTVTVTADAVPDKAYEGTVTKVGINGTSDAGVTTYPVDIRIDDTEGLLPAMNADVTIIVSESKGVLSLPAGAVERDDKVLVKTKDGTTGEGAPAGFAYAQVETGVSDEDYVQIKSGLEEGDTVAYIPETAGESDPFAQFGYVENDQAGNAQAGNTQRGTMP